MGNAENIECPLCRCPETQSRVRPEQDAFRITCPNCGTYLIDGITLDTGLKEFTFVQMATISYYIHQNQLKGNPPAIARSEIQEILRTTKLPEPGDRLDNLLLLIADKSVDMGEYVKTLDYRRVTARVGLADARAIGRLLEHLVEQGLATVGSPIIHESIISSDVSLTFSGWSRCSELRRKRVESRQAFMAMSYSNVEVWTAYEKCFKKACSRAGFDLKIVPEVSDTGSVTNHIVVAILNSKFVVSDLTDNNNGAYWEAGFAEGLERPVFYTCEADFFRTPPGTHFDTNHHVTTLWKANELEVAEQALVDRIRRKFPREAKMED